MRLWCRRVIRRRMICLWILLLAFALVALVLSDLAYWDQSPPRAPSPPRYPIHISGSLDLEVIVDSRDQVAELGVGFGHSPIASFQEDELLFVAATQGSRNPAAPPQRKDYQVLLPGINKATGVSTSVTHSEMALLSLQSDTELSSVQKYGFNEALSEEIPLHRTMPEARHPSCLGEQYSESLPSASVIICFHDEAWSTLLRTVHSVLDTVPKQFLHEILLLDDLSQLGHLKGLLSEYVAHLDGVHLIRSSRRLGVGACRSLGAARAAGEVLVFMDSHCECHTGWLEPLLERIAQDRTRVLSPIMDVINPQTLLYNNTRWPVRGVFDWRLDFYWESVPQPQERDTYAAIQPVRSPVLGGEVVAIDRHFFQSVGAYDLGMLLWGVEQIELSIRVWSCGGSMEVVPCSRVAHLERHNFPSSFPDQEGLQRNKIRVAEAWMDEYRSIFFRRDTLAHFIRQSEDFDVTERVRLKTALGCRNFHWFLSTVYPELYIPQDRPGLSGELYNVGTGYCADYPRGQGLHNGVMNIAPCSGTGNQHCELNSRGEVHWGVARSVCFNTKGNKVVLSPCPNHQPTHSNLQWTYIKLSGQLVHLQSQLCLEAVKEGGFPLSAWAQGKEASAPSTERSLRLLPCVHHPRQQWHFEQLVAPKGG